VRFRSIRSAAALYIGPPSIGEPPSPKSLRPPEALYIPHAHFKHGAGAAEGRK
jgi:hypothetical protein